MIGNINDFELNRFIEAQEHSIASYERAFNEVRAGRKVSHWIWYIFPQLDGMGHSHNSRYYGIKSLAEARAYLLNNILGSRLRIITQVLLQQDKPASEVFGSLDAMKVRSCMTLFDIVSPNDVFAEVLHKFYGGSKCQFTLDKVKEELSQQTSSPSRTYNGVPRPMYTPERLQSLRPDEVFVFGSNLAGAHGGGAARTAYHLFGAVMGQGVGLQGQSYAIPTMHGGVDKISPYVDQFIAFASEHAELFFYVTKIGCGIAGFRDEQIAPLFAGAQNLPNVCLPQSFVDNLGKTLPQEFKAEMYGQVRTMVDILKSLNEEEPLTDTEDAMQRLRKVLERNIRYGDNVAFTALRTLWHLLSGYEERETGVDLERLEQEMHSFHSFDACAGESLRAALYHYSAHKIIKYILFLNEFRRYTDPRRIIDDLDTIPVSHCSANEPNYYFSFSHFAYFAVSKMLREESGLFKNGKLDADALEEAAFGRFEKMVTKHGIHETLRRTYGMVGCHENLRAPKPNENGNVWGPIFKVEEGRIEKGCGDFRSFPFTNTSFEMGFALEILRHDSNYVEVDECFIPVEDYTLPVYNTWHGKLQFQSEEEKIAFIKLRK